MHRLAAIVLLSAAFCLVSSRADARLDVVVDKSSQQMWVVRDGEVRYIWNVSTGRDRLGTPSGIYQPERLVPMWRSNAYYNSPMPYSIFFHKGYAIHGSYAISQLGGPASHGCVRLHPRHAAILFDLVQQEGPSNTRIVVTGHTPVLPPVLAARDMDRLVRSIAKPEREDVAIPPRYADVPRPHPPRRDITAMLERDDEVEPGPPRLMRRERIEPIDEPEHRSEEFPRIRPPRRPAAAAVDWHRRLRSSPVAIAPLPHREPIEVIQRDRDPPLAKVSRVPPAPAPILRIRRPATVEPANAPSEPPSSPHREQEAQLSNPEPAAPASSRANADPDSTAQSDSPPWSGYKLLPKSYWSGAAWRWR